MCVMNEPTPRSIPCTYYLTPPPKKKKNSCVLCLMYLTKTEISHLEQGQDQFLCTGPRQLTVAPSVTDKGPGFQRTDAEVFLGAEHDVVESGALPTASMVQITIQPQPVHTPVEKQNKQFTYLPQS